MNSRKIIYIMIMIICIISLAVGVYTQMDKVNKETQDSQHINTVETQETAKESFDSIFNNKFDSSGSDNFNKNKIDDSRELIYSISSTEKKEEHYEFNINLPVININSTLAKKFNAITQTVFADKANSIMNNTNGLVIYTVEYTSYIKDNILTVVIRSTLKEGTTAQRVIVQTYNYNLNDDTELTINQAVEKRGISKDKISSKIQTQIKAAIKESEELTDSGYQIYNRDINASVYEIENTENFYIGKDGKLYIIYAYGNNQVTSEIDIIVI